MISFGPENPTKKIAQALVNDFKSRLQQWDASYKECVSSVAKVRASKLKFVPDDLHLRWEKATTTLVLDYPRLTISYDGSIYEMRTCLAICTRKASKASSKIWGRVSLPVDVSGIPPRIRVDQVPDLCPWFRYIADGAIGWAFDKIREIMPQHLPNSELETKGIIKATILGIADSDLAAPFEQLCGEGVTASNMLRDAALDQKLTSYCQKVSAIDGMLSSYTEQTGFHKPTWFKIPLYAVLSGGEIVNRIVLFFMRDVEGYSEIIGLAYDDSERGDLALRAGAKLSKIIGPWI